MDAVGSLCLTNGLANDEFRKQLTIKPVWSWKERQVIVKEFIYHEEVNQVVAATKNPQAHTAPRDNGLTNNPQDNQRDPCLRETQDPPKQKFDHYTPLITSLRRSISKSQIMCPSLS
ncbi:hypothetical protein PIB30_017015 [Stylosanthes scabra]|uniref:Uncharacterized protein n=1 Tax=Stylosanthes scabra TaxID=79078 RepID=A0ABU6Q8H3_9FABA|nr:hypothetical protein [Stylosanthes scabra]